jgi:hypothetical protein
LLQDGKKAGERSFLMKVHGAEKIVGRVVVVMYTTRGTTERFCERHLVQKNRLWDDLSNEVVAIWNRNLWMTETMGGFVLDLPGDGRDMTEPASYTVCAASPVFLF